MYQELDDLKKQYPQLGGRLAHKFIYTTPIGSDTSMRKPMYHIDNKNLVKYRGQYIPVSVYTMKMMRKFNNKVEFEIRKR